MPRLSALPPAAKAWLNSFDSGKASPRPEGGDCPEGTEPIDMFSTLPDEILTMILELAVLKSDEFHPYCPCKTVRNFSAVKSLALVCRRFHCILRPLLYYSLELRVPYKLTTGKLYRRLRTNPSVWSSFHVLSIWVGWLNPQQENEAFWLVQEVVSWLKELRCLTIMRQRGYYSTEPLIPWFLSRDSIMAMRALTHLTISNVNLGSCLGDMPSLKVLDIQNASAPDDKAVLLGPEVSRLDPLIYQVISCDQLSTRSSCLRMAIFSGQAFCLL